MDEDGDNISCQQTIQGPQESLAGVPGAEACSISASRVPVVGGVPLALRAFQKPAAVPKSIVQRIEHSALATDSLR